MYQGKYSKRKSAKRRLAPAALALALVLLVSVGGTLAYLIDKTTPVTNTFTPAEVSCSVQETFDGTTKSNVCIQNGDQVKAYIRAAIVVTWQDADGNDSAQAPVEGTDYSAITPESGWEKYTDGYYYYTQPLEPDGKTTNLIPNCQALKAGPESYTLSVEILAQAIQAEPITAASEAWGDSIPIASGN